jgi:hypothetical protein
MRADLCESRMQSTKYLHNPITLTNFLSLSDLDVLSHVNVTREILLKTIQKQTSDYSTSLDQ